MNLTTETGCYMHNGMRQMQEAITVQ